RSLTRMLSRRTALQAMAAASATVAAGSTMSSVFAQATPEDPGAEFVPFDGPLAENQTIRLPLTEPVTMDPGASTGFDELAIFFNIYDGLTRVDQRTGEIVGAAAESWEWTDDLLEYTFHL